jgi:hypothetical protein
MQSLRDTFRIFCDPFWLGISQEVVESDDLKWTELAEANN